jgi:hypothetical protein
MTYQELKQFDLNSIKSQEEADNFTKDILSLDDIDIIKYINFLRWQQYNSDDIKYISRIIKILSVDELKKINNENAEIITGDVEDLIIIQEVEKKEIENPIYIDGVVFTVKAILKDDFENVMIVSPEIELVPEDALNMVLAEEFMHELKLLFIPMDIEELTNYGSNKNIQDSIECIEALKDEEDSGFKKTMIEMLINKVREDNSKDPIVRTNIKPLQKYGFITYPKNYAYELYDEPQEYYNQIIEAKVGTKLNILCDIYGEDQISKTFTKTDLDIHPYNFELVKKTNLGIISNVSKEGIYNIIKKENVISNLFVKKQNNNPEKTGMVNVFGLGQMKQEDLLKSIKAASKSVSKVENNIKEYTKDDFRDNFKFDEKWHFTVTESKNYGDISRSTLIFNGSIDHLNVDEKGNYKPCYDYVNQVYELLYTYFGVVEDMEGYWTIDNSMLERVIRKIISSGAICIIQKDTECSFLQKIIQDKKIDKINCPKMNMKIIKTIRTSKELKDFAKNTGTELYVQIGQNIVSVLEGTQRLYGPNHIVFDSNDKLIICQYDKLDLYEASCYAIENSYSIFYDIQKDKYQEYDAWYKEKMILMDDETVSTDIKIIKHCNKCNTDKDISEFYMDKRKKDGHRYTCKECENKK